MCSDFTDIPYIWSPVWDTLQLRLRVANILEIFCSFCAFRCRQQTPVCRLHCADVRLSVLVFYWTSQCWVLTVRRAIALRWPKQYQICVQSLQTANVILRSFIMLIGLLTKFVYNKYVAITDDYVFCKCSRRATIARLRLVYIIIEIERSSTYSQEVDNS